MLRNHNYNHSYPIKRIISQNPHKVIFKSKAKITKKENSGRLMKNELPYFIKLMMSLIISILCTSGGGGEVLPIKP